MSFEKKHISPIAEKPGIFPLAGFIFGLFIWVIDAIIDVTLLNDDQSLLSNIFSPDEPSELWMRTLILITFVSMGFYSRHVLIKHIELDKILLDYQQRLEEIIHERTQTLIERTEQLEILASTDSLTGLFNRRKFTQLLNQELIRYQRYQQKFSILILDIDYFKNVNDTYGHDTGDKVLIEFSDIIENNIRSSDSFGRWGGEEFILLLIESDQKHTEVTAKKLLNAINTHTFDTVGKITTSIGVSQPLKNDTNESIIKRADNALYNAKDNGRDRIEFV